MIPSTLLENPISSTMRASLRSLRADWHDETAPDEARESRELSEEIEAWEEASDEALEIFDQEFPPLEN